MRDDGLARESDTSATDPLLTVISRLRQPFERLYDALIDPQRSDRTVARLLVGFVVLYTLYALIAFGRMDVHFDFGEGLAWSRRPAWGYKHPPMSAWILWVWFALFPIADWSAYLLAMVVSASSIWIAWYAIRDWLDIERRALALAMLLLVPLYSFHALKFNANTVMMPFWAASAVWFLRSVTRHDVGASLGTGLAAAGALLGKYWSLNLIAGLGLASIFDRRRAKYFRSPTCWIAIGVGLVAITPHLLWLRQSGREAIAFASSIQVDYVTAAGRSLEYVSGSLAYAVMPILLLIALRPSRATIRETLLPRDPDRALIAMAFWFPLLLPAVLNLALPTRLTSIWSIPDWTLLPVVLLGASTLRVTRHVSVTALALACAVPLLALAAAPALAVTSATSYDDQPLAHVSLLARVADSSWHRATTAPLALLGGDYQLTNGVAFYSRERPVVRPEAPLDSSSVQRIEREGIVILCRVEPGDCTSFLDSAASRWPAAPRRDTVALTRKFLGRSGPTAAYVMLVILPVVNSRSVERDAAGSNQRDALQ